MITFVVFLVHVAEETAKTFFRQWEIDPKRSGDGYLMFDFQYAQDCLRYLEKSIKYYHPDARLVILTDRQSLLEPIGDAIIKRYDLDVDSLALSKIQAYTSFLDEAKDSDHIFLDSDMLVNANLEFIFHKQFDVGLTFLPSKIGQNIGSSLFFFPQSSIEKGRAFFHEMLTRFDKYKQKMKSWYGDQQCLKDYFKKKGIIFYKAIIENDFRETLIEAGNTTFLFLPGHLYNRTYMPGQNLHSPPYVIHFKGGRKIFMAPYFREHFIS